MTPALMFLKTQTRTMSGTIGAKKLSIGFGLLGFVLLFDAAALLGVVVYDPHTNHLAWGLSPPALPFFPSSAKPHSTPERLDNLDPFSLPLRPRGAAESQPYFALGSDLNGRDIYSRLVQASGVYIVPGLITLLVVLSLGCLLGALAGYREGLSASAARYIIELFQSFPKLMVILLSAALYRTDFNLIMIVLGLLTAPQLAEAVQARIRSLRESRFVEAARSIGLADSTIILKHLIWYNCRSLLAVHASFTLAEVIILETTLSYLGFGIQEPTASWGNMVIDGGPLVFDGVYWVSLFPGLLIVTTILGLLLVGDGLDEKSRSR